MPHTSDKIGSTAYCWCDFLVTCAQHQLMLDERIPLRYNPWFMTNSWGVWEDDSAGPSRLDPWTGTSRPYHWVGLQFETGLTYLVRTITPHNPISRMWGWDHGTVLGMWRIVLDVTIDSQGYRMSGNKWFIHSYHICICHH